MKNEPAEQEDSSSHYDAKYYRWHASIGEFGGWANQTKFQDYLSADDAVLDFGCGGGQLLRSMKLARRIGIEVNPVAAEEAKKAGIEVFTKVEDCPDNVADVMISNNALEHTLRPLDELKSLMPKVKPGGLCVFVVPCENISYKYKPKDRNHHLYSWSPMSIGNLFTEAGYELIESKPYIHKWPRHFRGIARYGGRRVFEIACRIKGQLERTWFQIRVVARRPENDE